MIWDGKTERRKNRMTANFEPQDAFQGYMVASVEAIKDRLNALPCTEQNKRIGKVENDMANIKGKATVFGTLFGAVSGLLAGLFGRYVSGK